MTSQQELRWNVLGQLFPSLENVIIQNAEKIPSQLNGFKDVPSVFVEEKFLESVLKMLTDADNGWKEVQIRYPINTEKLLNKLIRAHSKNFKSVGFEMAIGEGHDPRSGQQCKLFSIEAE